MVQRSLHAAGGHPGGQAVVQQVCGRKACLAVPGFARHAAVVELAIARRHQGFVNPHQLVMDVDFRPGCRGCQRAALVVVAGGLKRQARFVPAAP